MMVTMISLILAVKYLLCGPFPSEPPVLPKQVSMAAWEIVPYSFQIDWEKRPDASIVENREANVD